MNKPRTGKSRTNCSVSGCHSCSGKDRTIGFHNYPEFGKTTVLVQLKTGGHKTMDRRRAWEYVLRGGEPVTTNQTKVCSLHFKIDDYILPSVVRRKALKTIAVPSLNLPVNKKSDTVEKFEFIDVNNMPKTPEYSDMEIKKDPVSEMGIKVENDITDIHCDYIQIKSEFVDNY